MMNQVSSSRDAAPVRAKNPAARFRTEMAGILAAVLVCTCMPGPSVSSAAAAEAPLTPEYIQKSHPDLYRQIQEGPRLPPPEVNPEQPYDPYPGFFAQPVLKPGQIEDWWENSSYDYSPVYPYLLKHTHLKFSYAKTTGNDEGHAWKGAILVALRKDRFTNVLGYQIDQKYIVSTDGSKADKDSQSFEETALYELNRYLFAEAGFHWQRMSQFMIRDRFIPFIGAGTYNILQDVLNSRQDRLGLHLGFARVTDQYYQMVTDRINKDSDTFNGLYGRADYSHKFNDMFTYKQEFTVKQALDRTPVYALTTIPRVASTDQKSIVVGSTKRYDWRWSNSLEFALNQYVGFLISYDVAFDSNAWPISVKRDTEFMSGFKFAF